MSSPCPKCGDIGWKDTVAYWPGVHCIKCGKVFYTGKNKAILDKYWEEFERLEVRALDIQRSGHGGNPMIPCPTPGCKNRMAINSKTCIKCRYAIQRAKGEGRYALGKKCACGKPIKMKKSTMCHGCASKKGGRKGKAAFLELASTGAIDS
jgi:hypothetical protein